MVAMFGLCRSMVLVILLLGLEAAIVAGINFYHFPWLQNVLNRIGAVVVTLLISTAFVFAFYQAAISYSERFAIGVYRAFYSLIASERTANHID